MKKGIVVARARDRHYMLERVLASIAHADRGKTPGLACVKPSVLVLLAFATR